MRKIDAYKLYIGLTFFNSLFFSMIFVVTSFYEVTVAGLSGLQLVLVGTTLEVVILLKSHIVAGLRAADSRRSKAAIGAGLWVVAAGSKLVVLALVDLIFGDAVSLGGFLPVTLLIVALLISRAAVRRLLESPRPLT